MFILFLSGLSFALKDATTSRVVALKRKRTKTIEHAICQEIPGRSTA